MRNINHISRTSGNIVPVRSQADMLADKLNTKGIIVLPGILNPEQISAMQRAFAARLKRMRWNHFDGYRKTEPFRLMVEDVLMLDQGFVDLALHPVIKQI